MYFLIIALIIVADIASKQWAMKVLKEIVDIPLINGVLHFTYVENRGAAFGILQNARWIFIVVSIAVVCGIVFLWWKGRPVDSVQKLGMSCVLGGAVGNLIDRLCLGYVVDFINVEWIKFPVFNIADTFVCIGAGLLFIYYTFAYKDDKG